MKNVWILLLILLCLSGCTPAQDVPDISRARVVSIQVESQGPMGTMQQNYTEPEKLHRILHTLRLLGTKTQTSQPRLSRERLCIRLLCADGSRRTYRVLGSDYFQADAGPWMRLQAGKGCALQDFFRGFPADDGATFPGVSLLPPLKCQQVYSPALRGCKIPCK